MAKYLEHKKCVLCDLVKEHIEFPYRNKEKGTRRRECKDCIKIKSREYRKLNREYYNEARRERYKNNPNKYKEQRKDWANRNPDKIKKYKKDEYSRNKEYILREQKKWVKANREHVRNYQNKYQREVYRKGDTYKKRRDRTKNERNRYMRDWHKNNNDVNYKLRRNLRSRLYHALKSSSKSGSSIKLLGCSIEEFRKYMESKFRSGMTWDNYSKWHIDHIIPLSWFNLEDIEQLKKAAHYTNLQPLWAEENLSKGAKLNETS